MAETTRKVRCADGTVVELRQYGLPGRYRWTIDDELFGQIIRRDREWHVELRCTETGALQRYAGVWASLREAVAELVDIQRRLPGSPIHRRVGDSAHIGLEHMIQSPSY